MMSKTTEECPLNKKCFNDEENIKCKWFINYPVTNSEGEVKDDWRCALVWVSVLEIELLNKLERMNKKEPTPINH
jgi:hypothetical protein